MANNTSPHILNTATNLLGFCLFVFTSLHVSNHAENSIIDEVTSVIAIMLAISCMFSFVSIRTENPIREKLMETVADYLFFSSLTGILVIILLIALNFIK